MKAGVRCVNHWITYRSKWVAGYDNLYESRKFRSPPKELRRFLRWIIICIILLCNKSTSWEGHIPQTFSNLSRLVANRTYRRGKVNLLYFLWKTLKSFSWDFSPYGRQVLWKDIQCFSVTLTFLQKTVKFHLNLLLPFGNKGYYYFFKFASSTLPKPFQLNLFNAWNPIIIVYFSEWALEPLQLMTDSMRMSVIVGYQRNWG